MIKTELINGVKLLMLLCLTCFKKKCDKWWFQKSQSPKIWPGGCIAYNSVCGGSFGGKCCPGSVCKDLAGGSKCVRDCVGCIQRPTLPTCTAHGSVCEPSNIEQCCPGSKCTEVTSYTPEERVISYPESKLLTGLITTQIYSSGM